MYYPSSLTTSPLFVFQTDRIETHADHSGTLSPRPGKHVQARQTLILKEINSLGLSSTINPNLIGRIDHLKQEYNVLVDERTRLEPGPSSDPIDRLPAELWPRIFKAEEQVGEYYNMRDGVDMLLDLTLVSRRWRRALLSTPVLWTDILLDQSRSDYLAKAAMCIHLSGRCEIDVYIALVPDSWEMASSLILPESKRIRSLYLNVEMPFGRKVLEEFGEMLTLKELSLRPSLARLNEDDLEGLGLRRMPALQSLRGQKISIDSESWRHLITYDHIDMVDIKKATIEQYGKLPNFHSVTIQHVPTPDLQEMVDTELYSRALDSSLSRVRSLTHRAPAFNRVVRWFGQNLTRLVVDTKEIDSIQELALSLALLPGLSSLVVLISNPQFTNKSHISVTPLRSITDLELRFTHMTWNDTQENWEHNAIVDSIYKGLVTIMPSVTSLHISYGILTEACFKYIEGLADLSGLDIHYCHPSRNYTVSLVAKNLRQLFWKVMGYCPTILTDINSPTLRNLYVVGAYDGSTRDSFTISSSISACYAISGKSFAGITSLTLGIVAPVRWELASLPALKVLKLSSLSPGSIIWASDIIEVILMRPCDLPVLDTINLACKFLEWDILLLMLERRILYSHLGISPIKTIIVPNQLPYKLLQPISTLLQGKLPERQPNDQFSLESAVQRLYNAEITGCSACCHTFRHCNMRTIPGDNPNKSGDRSTLLSLDYELPSEFLTADPPLTQDVTDWLSGKRARCHAFVQECNRVVKSFHRVTDCHRYLSSGTTTGYSLDGVNFQESLESNVE